MQRLFCSSSSHSLETSLVRLVNLGNLISVLGQLVNQLGSIQLTVTSSCLDNLGLLLQREVLPCEIWSHVFFEESQDLVVRDGTGIGEVIDTGFLVLSQENGGGEKIVEDGVGVWYVNYAVVFGDLGDKVSGVQVIADGHSKSEDEGVFVCLHNLGNS